jgi:hypothetical protein
MSGGKQGRLSAAEKADVWRRWKAGESLHEIERAHGKPHNCIRCVLLPRGGIAPAVRQRSGIALSLAEREDISLLLPSNSAKRSHLAQLFWDDGSAGRSAGHFIL